MQLITHKLIPPSTLPSVPEVKSQKYVYRLGVKFCPSMDLVATYPILTRTQPTSTTTKGYADSDSDNGEADKDKEANAAQGYSYGDDDEESVNVDVWRFNGQRVFTIAVESEEGARIEIINVEWRNDGQIVAILSSDRVIRLVNSFSGKVVHRFSSTPTYAVLASPTSPRTRRSQSKDPSLLSAPKPTVLSYTTHFSNPTSNGSLLHTATTESSIGIDDLLGLNADIAALLKAPADLPRELANIDVESFLPRLSCLPPLGFGGDDVFSARTSIDAIFHSSKKTLQSGTVDVLIAGHNDGTITVRIFNSFEIGGVDLNSATGLYKSARIGRVLKMVSSPLSSEVLVIVEDAKRGSLHLLGVDLKLITQHPNVLPILATKATQLQNLLRYLTQIQTQLSREVKTAFDLPSRYLRNVNEDLEKQDGEEASFTTAAYHTILTGEVSGAFKEWLNEQVGDRGVKRWEKSVGDCLELVMRLVSEAWCPAVERAGVVISRLSGLSRLQVQTVSEGLRLGTDQKLVEALQDTVDVMAVSGEECLRDVVEELSGFTAFIKWLKWEVEASALEDSSERLDEMREGSDHADIMRILSYIDKGPQESVVKSYLNSPLSSTALEHEDDLGFFARLKEQREKDGHEYQPPAFDQLLERMRRQCDSLFERIAQHLRQSIMTRYIAQLGPDANRALMDARIVSPDSNQFKPGHVQISFVARKQGDTTKTIYQTVAIDENQTKVGAVVTHNLQPPEVEEILDVKLVDDEAFMVLAKTADDVRVYSHTLEVDQGEMWEMRHQFKDGIMESGMTPARLEINGRKKRRTVGVVDESGKGYIVLDLDSGDVEQQTTTTEDEVMTG